MQQEPYSPPPRVTVADIDMPFWSMVWFMIKWAFASVPALIFIIVVSVALWVAVFAGFAAIGLGGAALMGGSSPSPSPTPSITPSVPLRR